MIRALGAFVVCAGFGVAADPIADGDLIRQLADANYKTREAAGRALEDRGEAALSTMRAAQGDADPEVIARGERNGLLTPRIVTLHVSQMPVTQVFAQIAEQTGYKIGVQPGNAQLVSLDIDNVPFWQCMDLIGKQTGLALHALDLEDEA